MFDERLETLFARAVGARHGLHGRLTQDFERDGAGERAFLADHFRACVVQGAGHLANVPQPRQTRQEEGTRELVMSPLPYIVVYTVRGDAVYVVRIPHGAQQWP